MSDTRALVVLSGGQDSTTCLGWALLHYDHVGCVTFNYGQRHARELEAAAAVVRHFETHYRRQIPHEIVDVPGILRGASPLTDHKAELETYTDPLQMAETIGDRVELTFVPMRNTLFLTIAANRAVADGYGVLVTGVCQEDNANYPDCTQRFIQRIERAFNASLGHQPGDSNLLDIETPLMHKSKADTVRLALDTPFTYSALAWSHTAYDGQYPPVGKDHASTLRAYGFEQADRPDPLVLRAVYEGLMPLPTTDNYRPANVEGFTMGMCDQWAKPGTVVGNGELDAGNTTSMERRGWSPN